jgi:hypothetical protein
LASAGYLAADRTGRRRGRQARHSGRCQLRRRTAPLPASPERPGTGLTRLPRQPLCGSPLDARRDVDEFVPLFLLLAVPRWPVATAGVAAIQNIDKAAGLQPRQVAISVTRQITPKVTVAPLAPVGPRPRWRVTAVGHTAKKEPSPKNEKAIHQAETPYRSIAECRTACMPRMKTIGAAKAFIGRNVLLVKRDCAEDPVAHGLSLDFEVGKDRGLNPRHTTIQVVCLTVVCPVLFSWTGCFALSRSSGRLERR